MNTGRDHSFGNMYILAAIKWGHFWFNRREISICLLRARCVCVCVCVCVGGGGGGGGGVRVEGKLRIAMQVRKYASMLWV